MNRRASSLVLVVVIMASIIVVVFGASRLLLVQYNQSNRDEDNIFALYAAKAAVEDGLMRFRYNRDAETTTADGKTATMQRFDLTSGTSYTDQVPLTEPISKVNKYDPTDQYYDMQMAFRGPQLGAFDTNNGGNPSNNPSVGKDDIVELTGFPAQWSSAYYLRYRFEFENGCDKTKSLVQIQQVSQTTDPNQPITYDQITVKYPAVGSVIDSITSGSNIFIRSTPGVTQSLTNSVRLRAVGCSVKYALATSNSTNGNGQGPNAGPKFDSFTTTITATGYYGKARRTLLATIDRVSGRLINIYDFTAFSGTGSIKP